jgi:para-nitrobenzyl esterase
VYHPAKFERRSLVVLTSVLAAMATVLVGIASAAPRAAAEPQTSDQSTIVRTDQGRLRGYATKDHLVFKGIPFAKPPVGRLRFRAPRPVEPWGGTRDATQAGSACAQTIQYGTPEPQFKGSEDCLYLNVHVPRGIRQPMPVMVFLHGGGFGQGDGGLYDPRPVSGRGDVVVVTPNYRLGALGFLHQPGLGGRWAGNFGIADQQAALRWVRRNIVAFGGDRTNVTLWGESAGAYSVCAQLASPTARGLFDKAITQSGPCGNDLLTRKVATRRAHAAAEELGCDSRRHVAHCLRAVPTRALADLGFEEVRLTRFITNLPWMPLAGTPAIPVQPLRAARAGTVDRVPMIAGGTRDEMRTYVVDRVLRGGGRVTAENYRQVVRELYGENADRVLARYPHRRYESPGIALATILTDEGRGAGACQQVAFDDAMSAHAPVFAFEFAEPTGRIIEGIPEGASHGADVPYFFDSYGQDSEPPAGKEAALANTLIDHWTRFARTGHPGGDWQGYRAGHARSFSTSHIGRVDLERTHRCDFWRTMN